jgi:hypothetical protein
VRFAAVPIAVPAVALGAGGAKAAAVREAAFACEADITVVDRAWLSYRHATHLLFRAAVGGFAVGVGRTHLAERYFFQATLAWDTT